MLVVHKVLAMMLEASKPKSERRGRPKVETSLLRKKSGLSASPLIHVSDPVLSVAVCGELHTKRTPHSIFGFEFMSFV